jgi:DNA-binding transcriptional ArsR family regulator
VTDEARIFAALADPTRRQVLDLLRTGERTVADLTAALPVSQSAVSQHLRVLRESGLVQDRPSGTRRYYRVDLEGLTPLRSFLDRFWDAVLDAFVTYADSPAADEPGEPR